MSGSINSSPIKRYVIKKSVESGDRWLLVVNPGTHVTLAVFRDIALSLLKTKQHQWIT